MYIETVQPIMEQRFRAAALQVSLGKRHEDSGARIANWFDAMVRVRHPDPLWQMFMPATLSVNGGYSLDSPGIPKSVVYALLVSAADVAPSMLRIWRNRVLTPSFWDLDVLIARDDPQFRRVCAVAKRFTIESTTT